MKNYRNNDYALNKQSDGIIYRFADGSFFTVTLASYLAENPGKTEDDFYRLKELSDSDYLERDRREYQQIRKNVSFERITEADIYSLALQDETAVNALENTEQRQDKIELLNEALNTLTETQRRRYLMHHVEGLSTHKIAEIEMKDHKSIHECLQASEKKIKKYFSKG